MANEPIGADEDGLIYDVTGERSLRRLRERQLSFITRTILSVIGDLDSIVVAEGGAKIIADVQQKLGAARAVDGNPTPRHHITPAAEFLHDWLHLQGKLTQQITQSAFPKATGVDEQNWLRDLKEDRDGK